MDKDQLQDELDDAAKALSKGINIIEAMLEAIPNNNVDSKLRQVRSYLVEANQMINNGADELSLAIFELEEDNDT